ncbi:hypothetical protein HID58_068430 [Brassica napus]|uniref:Secreted protein n=1 Tax=Brassica napus TaxID=3708 RepID=A0ABQ7ZLJ8_BRANA|nr:hypothetical protein HID58_068430 [Brassica napus]
MRQHSLTGTGLYLWRLCGACPGTSPWTVKVLRNSDFKARHLLYYSHKLKHKVIQSFSRGVGMFNG